MSTGCAKRVGLVVVMLALGTVVVTAAAAPPPPSMPATRPALDAPAALRAWEFWPDLGWSTLCWLAAAVTLALTLHLRPVWSLRNLDGVVLAGTCLLLALRDTTGPVAGWTCSGQWWAYLGLTAVALYWLVRGVVLLLTTKPVARAEFASSGARLVLLVVALVLCIHRIATAPLSAGARDGIVGGLCTAASGKLPYGDAAEFESRSPLVYLVYAGAVQVLPPTLALEREGYGQRMTWENRDWWLAAPWEESADLAAARLANAVLFVLLLAGLGVISSRWRASGSSWTMLALFCIFPGTLECLARPEVMLPAVLLTWSFAFALLAGVGGLLATLCLIVAGIAWPWAWLGLPVLLAHFWRRGWHGVGSTLGLAAGVALCACGLYWLVRPALPRADGALALAGLPPPYAARLVDQDTLVVDRRDVPATDSGSKPWSRWGWRMLVESESAALKDAEQAPAPVRINWPYSVNGSTVLYRQLDVSESAWPVVQTTYRAAFGQMSKATHLLAATRTVLEAAWMPALAREPAIPGALRYWAGAPHATGEWVFVRRGAKAMAGLLAVWVALAVFLGRRVRPRHLLGGLLTIAAGALLASEGGAVTNLVWVLPLVVALWAVQERPAPPVPAPVAPLPDPPSPVEPPPRITVDAGPTITPL